MGRDVAEQDMWGMAGRYTGSYFDRSNGWRAVATLADIGRASLVGRIPKKQLGLCQDDDNKKRAN